MCLSFPYPLEGRERLSSLVLPIGEVRTPSPALCIVLGTRDTMMDERAGILPLGFTVGVQKAGLEHRFHPTVCMCFCVFICVSLHKNTYGSAYMCKCMCVNAWISVNKCMRIFI